jgi:hypothetical protein
MSDEVTDAQADHQRRPPNQPLQLIRLSHTVTLTCTPEDILGGIASTPYVDPPEYLQRFEALKPGICTFQNSDFAVIVQIIGA